MLVKSELTVAGLVDQVETINIDHDDLAKEKIMNAGFMSVPILEVDGEFLHDFNDINAAITKLVG